MVSFVLASSRFGDASVLFGTQMSLALVRARFAESIWLDEPICLCCCGDALLDCVLTAWWVGADDLPNYEGQSPPFYINDVTSERPIFYTKSGLASEEVSPA